MLAILRGIWLPILIIVLCAAWYLLEQSPERAPGAVVLRWVINSQERDVQFGEAIKRVFERAHPDIRIQFIKQNEGQKVDAMIAGGDAPDIINVGMDKLYYYLDAGVLRDLSPLMTELDRTDLQSFFPVCVQPFQITDGAKPSTLYSQPSTRTFALPFGYVPFILIYNKGLFDKSGVPYPNDNWTWEDYRRAAIRLTKDTDGDGITDEFGAAFAQWQDGYYCWIYQNGGRVLTLDGQTATFDSPRVVEAFEFLRNLTREDRVMPTDVNKPKQTGIGLFEAGRLAMNGPTGSFYIPTYRKYEKIDWDIASVPSGPGGRGTIVAPLGFGVTTNSHHPREAWELVKFLCSEEGETILADSFLVVPARRSVAFSDRFLNGPGLPKNKYALVTMMDDRKGRKPWGMVPPWSGERWADVNDEALNSKIEPLLFGIPKPGQGAKSVCAAINKRANEILAESRAAKGGIPVNWGVVMSAAATILGIGVLAWVGVVWRSARGSRRQRSEHAYGYLSIAPWLIGFLLFGLGPIVFSALLSFTRYSSLSPPSSARFIGLGHYAWLLSGRDEFFHKALIATFRYVAMSVPLYLVSVLLLALLMNSKVRGIAYFRTLYYLPAIMPAVASAVLFRWVFQQQGLLNYLVGGFGKVPFQRMPNWLQDPSYAVPSIVIMGLWGVGAGMMIYLAGLQNIPTQLYEAAQIDGAGIIGQFRAVTLPMLSPVMFFNLVMGIIGAFQVFSTAFVLFAGSTGPEDSALFYSYYLYRKAFEQFQIGYGSALAWILFVIILIFTLLVFRSSSIWVYYESRKPGETSA